MRTWTEHALHGAVVALALTGCQEKSACVKNGVTVEITGNHGHEATVPLERVRDTVPGLVAVTGGGHQHALMLTEADMKALHDGKPVTTRTTSVQGHAHEVGVRCKE
jgi:hypothetical protein